MAPVEREPELNSGLWLVLVFAVWSGPDRTAVDTALSVAKEFRGEVRLGIRPFDKAEEALAWCPELKLRRTSPIWLILNNGKLERATFGPQTVEQLRAMIHDAWTK
jgi:hypothetical protein